uniref:Uncharacterized protein n=1 Tax=Ditylenchus dipsaci TaxID=166011 RepID=A0A915ESK2_9BILA
MEKTILFFVLTNIHTNCADTQNYSADDLPKIKYECRLYRIYGETTPNTGFAVCDVENFVSLYKKQCIIVIVGLKDDFVFEKDLNTYLTNTNCFFRLYEKKTFEVADDLPVDYSSSHQSSRVPSESKCFCASRSHRESQNNCYLRFRSSSTAIVYTAKSNLTDEQLLSLPTDKDFKTRCCERKSLLVQGSSGGVSARAQNGVSQSSAAQLGQVPVRRLLEAEEESEQEEEKI